MEQVILLHDDGTVAGAADKATVHGADTPLHLAFSCYLVRDDGRMLITRRALSKRAWPGVWTNSFCGHPAPGEPFDVAITRRAADELGTRVDDITLVLPDFRYRAIDAGGVVEHEICPVHIARINGKLQPNPDEVSEWQWVDPDDLARAVTAAPFAFSPWLVAQLPQLAAALTAYTADDARTATSKDGTS